MKFPPSFDNLLERSGGLQGYYFTKLTPGQVFDKLESVGFKLVAATNGVWALHREADYEIQQS